MANEPDLCPHGTDRKYFNCENCAVEERRASAPAPAATTEQARDKAAAIVQDTKPPRGWQHFVLLLTEDGKECAMAYHPEMNTKDLEMALAQIAGHLRAQGELDAE